MTGRVSFRNSSLTLKDNQKEVPTLLWTKEGGLSGAIMAAHSQTHTRPHTHTVNAHTHTEAQGNTGERLLL